MAKRTKKQKQRAAARRPAPGVPAARPLTAAAGESDVHVPADAEPLTTTMAGPAPMLREGPGEPVAGRRRLERVSPGAAAARPSRPGRAPASAAAMLAPLDTEDAAIPFDRVPYVPADLRRVAIMAVLMIALIIVAAIIVSNVVH